MGFFRREPCVASESPGCAVHHDRPDLGLDRGRLGLVVVFCSWTYCIVKAYSGVLFKLPVLGDFVEDLAK